MEGNWSLAKVLHFGRIQNCNVVVEGKNGRFCHIDELKVKIGDGFDACVERGQVEV